MKSTRNKRTYVIQLYEKSRTGKFIDTERRLEVIRVRVNGEISKCLMSTVFRMIKET